MDPNPTRLVSLIEHEDVEKHRSVCCAGYGDCLDAASRRHWKSWTCKSCELFVLTREMRHAEMAHAAGLRPFA